MEMDCLEARNLQSALSGIPPATVILAKKVAPVIALCADGHHLPTLQTTVWQGSETATLIKIEGQS
jgi:hypothetical protein